MSYWASQHWVTLTQTHVCNLIVSARGANGLSVDQRICISQKYCNPPLVHTCILSISASVHACARACGYVCFTQCMVLTGEIVYKPRPVLHYPASGYGRSRSTWIRWTLTTLTCRWDAKAICVGSALSPFTRCFAGHCNTIANCSYVIYVGSPTPRN